MLLYSHCMLSSAVTLVQNVIVYTTLLELKVDGADLASCDRVQTRSERHNVHNLFLDNPPAQSLVRFPSSP
jgi:hypothetical protein